MSALRVCVVCDKNTERDHGRCTNGCCGDCHLRYCTSGGNESPGHRLDLRAARVRHAQETHDEH